MTAPTIHSDSQGLFLSPAESAKQEGVTSGLELDWAAVRAEQRKWARWPVASRLQIIKRFRHLLAERAEGIALRLGIIGGTSSREILVSQVLPLADACRFLERFGEGLLEPRRWKKRGRPVWMMGVDSEVHREPHGIVLVLGPSNYPLLLPGVQIVQALTAGNAVVFKPGLEGGEAADELAVLWREAGLPSGLLRVLPSTHAAGSEALAGPIDHVVLTGSLGTGRQVLQATADRVLSTTMELSGSDSVIVRADADLELAVKAIWHALMLNQGATCIAPRKVWVHRHCERALRLKFAHWNGGSEVISLSSEKARALRNWLREVLQSGAEVIRGGWNEEGQLVAPLILSGVDPAVCIEQESTFVPVLCICTVASDEEAVQWVERSRYRLGVSVFSASETESRELARECSVGVVTVNDVVVPTADPRIPFGGRGRSGFGVTRGAEGLLSMTCCKSILVRSGEHPPHLEPVQPEDSDLFLAWIQWSHGARWRDRWRSLVRLMGLVWARSRRSRRTAPNPEPVQPEIRL